MGRSSYKLTVKQVQSLKEPGRYSDGNGLYLKIAKGGSKSWVLMLTLKGKKQERGLGSHKDVTLAEARVRAEDLRKSLQQGIDPGKKAKAAKKVPTFGEMADNHIERMASYWNNSKHGNQWRMTLGRKRDNDGALTTDGYCLSIRDRLVSDIDTEAILEILEPIWKEKAETAKRVRGRIEAVLDAAKVAGHREGPNPAAWKGHLAHLLPVRKKASQGHHAAMPYKDVPTFIQKLHLIRGTGSFALEFLILTAARSGEVRLACWPEVDHKEKVWIVPANRMKAEKEHRVPLSSRAIELLEIVAQLRTEGSDLIFPGTKVGRPLSDMTLGKVVKRHADAHYTVHGFRSSFRDWTGDKTDFPREVAEAALAHQIGNAVEVAYRREDALEKRRALMNAWEKFCLGR